MEPTVHNKSHKIKLQKDLKYGNSRFRQSLLDYNEVQNLQKIFKTTKKKLSIYDRKIQQQIMATQKKQDINEVIEIPSNQKIKQHRKQQYLQRMNKKMKISFKKPKKKGIYNYQSPLKQIARSFQNDRKRQYSSDYLCELKQSQIQLQFIKKNYNRTRLSTYQSPVNFTRNSIISIQNGLPKQIQQEILPFDICLKKMKQVKQVRKLSLVDDINARLNAIYRTIESQNQNKQQQFIKSKKKNGVRKDGKSNIDITNSIKNTRTMLNTYNGFIELKKKKKAEYQNLITTWKVDKPFVDQLRRKNYKSKNF